jgi:hypothetical protein
MFIRIWLLCIDISWGDTQDFELIAGSKRRLSYWFMVML